MAHKSQNLAYINWGVCYVADAAFLKLNQKPYTVSGQLQCVETGRIYPTMVGYPTI